MPLSVINRFLSLRDSTLAASSSSLSLKKIIFKTLSMKRVKEWQLECFLVGIMLRAQSAALHQPRLFRGRAQQCLFSTDESSSCAQVPTLSPKLAASRLGLDPFCNRFHAPIVNHENYSFKDWPPNHTFPMDKFARLAHALTSTTSSSKTHSASSNLPRPLVWDPCDFFRPVDLANVPRNWLAEPTGPIAASFLDRFMSGQLDDTERGCIGFRDQTNRPELIERTVLEVAGTVLAAQLAFRCGIASNVAGGTHHAHRTGGAGYTILNDLAVTANFLTDETLNEGSVTGVKRVLVLDCDVHQGKYRKDHHPKKILMVDFSPDSSFYGARQATALPHLEIWEINGSPH
jgi:hypothetical protein